MQLMAPYIIMTSCSMLGGQLADYAIRNGVDKSCKQCLASTAVLDPYWRLQTYDGWLRLSVMVWVLFLWVYSCWSSQGCWPLLCYQSPSVQVALQLAVSEGSKTLDLSRRLVSCCGLTMAIGHEAAKLDVAPPEYVGMLQGVSNTLAALSGVIGTFAPQPLLDVGLIAQYRGSHCSLHQQGF